MKSIFALVLFFASFATAQVHQPSGLTDSMSCVAATSSTTIIDAELDKCLKTSGVRFEVHGISVEDRTAVITYRSTTNFFVFRHMSLISKDSAVRAAIFALKRHDVVIVKGAIGRVESPQKHVSATAIVVETPSTAHDGMPDYKYDTPPEEVLTKSNLTAVVHGIFHDGAILVLEYGDRVIPVFVEARYVGETKNLYRSDVIEINYAVQESPGHPIHLNLTGNINGKSVPPVTVKQSILAQSGQQIDVTGELVMYPKSPQIPFNIFAVKQDLGQNLRRYYTLVNVEDPNLFKAIREKLQAAWDAETTGRQNDRNKWINTKIRVRARGVSNTQDPNQANPQILLGALTDVEVVP